MIVIPPSGDVEAQREGNSNWSLKEASIDTQPADCKSGIEDCSERRSSFG